MPKSNKQRQAESDDRQRALGRKQSKWWLTPGEKVFLRKALMELRKSA